MKIKKYLVNSVDEALGQIKRELGEDAYILSTKKIQQKGQLNLSSRELVEVVAAVENERKLNQNGDFKKQAVAAESPLTKQKLLSGINYKYQQQDELQEKLAPLAAEIAEIKKMVKIAAHPLLEREEQFAGANADLYLNLLSAGVEINLAKRIIAVLIERQQSSYNGDIDDEKRVFQIISSFIEEPQPLRVRKDHRKVAVFVGPTGVGKTTTIAKLASYFRLIQNKKVALISIDSYRIGAEQHLRTYADLLQVPFYAVYNYQDLQFRLQQMPDYELVLIDTTGRSGFDRHGLLQNKGILDAVPADQKDVFLVVSATTKTDDLFQIYHNFMVFNPGKLLISKVDETMSLGNVFSLKVQSGLAVSYFTTGQRVPEDIEVVNPKKFARLVVKRSLKEDL